VEALLHEREAFQYVFERALVEEQLRPAPESSCPAHRSQLLVEKFCHAALVRRRMSGDKNRVRAGEVFRFGLRQVLDFALPPRCAGCGTIVADLHSFCADCWTKVEFLGESGCATCGIPLEATDADTCGACIAQPPRIERTRAAVVYDELSRSIALRLKYGRKVALARTMARYMTPLVQAGGEPTILVPVPLHRTRLWHRGFNQSVLVARELARSTGLRTDPHLLKRVKRTPALKGMSLSQRRKLVAGAFQVDPKADLQGRTIVLVDDVLTTGSTANACAKALQKAGAGRVELVSWARVIRPTQLS
jgi:ComF family protein